MLKNLALAAFVAFTLVSVPAARADEATLKDIQATLGLVPTFLKTVPAEQLPGAWADFKALQLNPSTALPGKVKELIGLAVASQIPCRYCIYFHTEAAKLNGATEREVREAVAVASLTRKWSTILNGNQVDVAQFRSEIGRAFEFAAHNKPGPARPVTDAASAYKDIERVFGVVPTFMKLYPEGAIAGAWIQMRDTELGATAIPGKYKELMALAVAAQIPCTYCVIAHTEGARGAGASDAEIREAVAMSAMIRQWSTWLNGTQQDEAQFRREVDAVVALVKKQLASRK